jgi:AmmeMemoRadiSam system protein B/AmmeMemoRadiSam system protein A
MRKLVIAAALIFIVMDSSSQQRSSDRQPVAAGRFYTASGVTLAKDIAELFETCVKITVPDGKVRAIISPHAGYVFSGKVAASAFSAIDRKATYKNIFLIGSSHVMAFAGASPYYTGDFITPLGRAVVNKEIANKLRENKLFSFPVDAHKQEHSLEVQVPLIQYWFSNEPELVPIIIGTNKKDDIRKIAEILRPWFTPDNLFVISSDFSHYPSYKTANMVDRSTADAIVAGDPEKFLTTLRKNSQADDPGLVTSMCGWTSGLLLLYLAEGNSNLQFRKIDYCNSGDSKFGDREGVVGYNAIGLFEKPKGSITGERLSDEIRFTDKEKTDLISLARNNIRSLLYEGKRIAVDREKLPEIFNKPLGAFVTLKINGNLRGCIGKFVSSDPLYEVVLESSQSSAFGDPRFSRLTKDEFAGTDMEITVLGPMRKIESINEIELGRHGIYIKKDYRSGTMLPQVATENKWTVEQFLGYTSRDKAGLGWDGWKNADIFIYEGIVIEEEKK